VRPTDLLAHAHTRTHINTGQKFQTKVIDNNLDPQWGEEFTFKLKEAFDSTSYVEIEVYDYNKISSKVLLGKCAVPLAPLSSAESSQTWYRVFGFDTLCVCV